MKRSALVWALMAWTTGANAAGHTFVLTDCLHHTWRNERVCYELDAKAVPTPATLIGPDGKPVPVQVTPRPNGKVEVAFIVDELPADGKVVYRLKKGKPVGTFALREAGTWLELDAGPVAVRVPKPGDQTFAKPVPLDRVAPPILSIRGSSGTWLGKGRMAGSVGVKRVKTTLVAGGPVYAEVQIAYTLTVGQYTARVRVVRGQDAVLVWDEFNTTQDAVNKACFQFSLNEGLKPERVALRGRLWRKRRDARKLPRGQADYAIDFDQDRRELSVIGYSCWWPETTRVITLYGSKTPDTLSFFPRRIGQWRNPMGTYLQTRKSGRLFLSWPLYMDQEWGRDGMDRTSAYYTGRLEPGWPGSACRRLYALFVSTRDRAVPDKGRSSVAEAVVRYSDLMLDKIKDWTFEWNSRGVKYPRLYVNPKDLKAVRKRALATPGWARQLGAYWQRPVSYILQRDPKIGDELLHFTNDRPGSWTVWGALPALRYSVSRLFDGWGYLSFLAPNNAAPMYDLVRFDAALSVKQATKAEKTEMRRLMSFVAQMVYDNDWHPVKAGWHLGNPNMPPRQEHHLGVASRVLPKHPLAKAWAARGAAELKRLVDSMTRPSGAWRECPHYEWGAAMYPMFQSAVPIRLSGGFDLFAYPKLKKTWDYLVGILTPPSPRFRRFGQRLRVLPAFGNGSWEFMPLTGWLAAMTKDTDPAFSKRMMWAWNAQGRPIDSKMSRLVIDPNLPAEQPDLKSTLYKGFGCTLRSGFPSEYETWMAFRHGDCMEHYNYGDQGSFMLYGKGAPLVLHFGSIYTPYFKGAWHFNRACVGHRLVQATDPAAKLLGDTYGDFAVGTELWCEDGSNDYVMHNKAFATLTSADYACAEQVQQIHGVIGKDHTIRRPPNTALLRHDIPDHTWTRRVLMLKDPDPRAPNYYLIRDDFTSGNPLPGEWNIWTLAEKVDVKRRPAVVTGKYGVDLDVFMAEPADPRWSTRTETNKYLPTPSRRVMVHKKWIEVQTNLRAQQAPGKGFLAVLYPRFHTEKPATFQRIAGGRGVKVTTPRGTDWAFLSADPVRWSGDGLTFSGTAGAIRRVGDVYEIIFVEPGEITVANRTIRAGKPLRTVISPR